MTQFLQSHQPRLAALIDFHPSALVHERRQDLHPPAVHRLGPRLVKVTEQQYVDSFGEPPRGELADHLHWQSLLVLEVGAVEARLGFPDQAVSGFPGNQVEAEAREGILREMSPE